MGIFYLCENCYTGYTPLPVQTNREKLDTV